MRARLKTASPKARTARLAAAAAEIDAILADGQSDWVYLRFLPSLDQVRRIHAAKKQLFIAGPLVAGPESANWSQAASLGMDAILTDYPLELAAALKSKPQEK